MRYVCCLMNDLVLKYVDCTYHKLVWTSKMAVTYQAAIKRQAALLKRLNIKSQLQMLIYAEYYWRMKYTFLIGFSKLVNSVGPNADRIRTACYTANLYCFGDKLCYHLVHANSVDEAKKMVKQKHHAAKRNPQDKQLI